MEHLSNYLHQSGYVKFIQVRLTYLAVIFMTLFSIALSLASIIRNQTVENYNAWVHWIGFAAWVVVFLLVKRFTSRWTPNQDPYLLDIMYLCCGWGLMLIWRLSAQLGIRQTLWFILGSVILLLIQKFPGIIQLFKRYTFIWLVLSLLLIFLTLIPGFLNGTNQTNLWLNIAGFTVQPSEPLKLIFIVYLSAYFSKTTRWKSASLSVIIPSGIMAMAASLVLLAQRDLGTTSLLMAIYIMMVYIGTGDKKFLIGGVMLFVICFIAGYFLFDVIQLRVSAWINPWNDPEGRSYQIIQAMIAQASGGIFGTGPGMGSPFLVPVAVSDFIYSTIAEENGLLGSTAVVLLILLFTYRGFSFAIHSKDKFLVLLSSGISLWIFVQAMLIIGGNIRLFPLTGVTLPFFSYGGSSLVICMAGGGLLTLISSHSSPAIVENNSLKNTPLQPLIFPALLIIALVAMVFLSLWAFILKDDLTSRSDNLRLALADTVINRGEILDRNGEVLNGTEGSAGNLTRVYNYPPLSTTTGYSSILYGQSGLESIMDGYLRGRINNTPFSLWWNYLLYNHPPAGSSIKLTIELPLQKYMDDRLGQNKGSIIVINAESGELLAVVSHPYFDPSLLSENWDSLITDPDSPLLNRAFFGKYPPGTGVGPFILGEVLETNQQLPTGSADPVSYKGRTLLCTSFTTGTPTNLAETLQNGCPQSLINLGRILDRNNLYNLYTKMGFYASPDFIFQGASIDAPTAIDNLKAGSIGQENLSITPLQMVLAASAISSGGEIPAPTLVLSNQLPDHSWSLLQPRAANNRVFSTASALSVGNELTVNNYPAWGITGSSLSSSTQTVSWFVGGTNEDWRGIPISFVVLLEEGDDELVNEIGISIIETITFPGQ